MKKLLFAALFLMLILPLFAQELDEEIEEDFIEDQSEQTKKPFTFPRERFEIGFDVNAGFGNDLFRLGDILKKDLVIDLTKWGNDVLDTGLNLNAVVLGGLYINIKNINIGGGVWDFGFFSGADGNLDINVPKSLFTLISEGNIKQRSFNGTISASGGVFANAGLSGSAKYGKLRVGAKPVLFVPLMVIPQSGINFSLETEEKISLTTSGQIAAYGVIADVMEKRDAQIQTGFDISLEGEYELFSFLDVGGSLSRIPFIPAIMKNRTIFTMDDFIADDNLDLPDFEINSSSESVNYNVFRPLRFDVYARYKPFKTNIFSIIVKPNIGFSVSINDEQGYFNAGLEGQLNIKDMFLFHMGTGYVEAIWEQRLGFAFNVRAFELDLEAVFRSQNFVDSFAGKGFGLNLGLRFGW